MGDGMSDKNSEPAGAENNDETVTPGITQTPNAIPIFSLRFLRAFMHLLFRLTLSFFFFYVLGNYYNFLDKNQLQILRSLQITAAASAVVSFLLTILQILFFVRYKKKRYLKYTVTPAIVFLLSVVCTVFASTIVVLSRM